MSRQLHRNIAELKGRIRSEGDLVQHAIAKSIVALLDHDRDLAHDVIAADQEIDRSEVYLEDEICRLLALFQPVAIDLRMIVGVLKINADLERMGDLAKNIAKRVVRLTADYPGFTLSEDFRNIAQSAQRMARQSLESFVSDDVALAQQVRLSDRQVNALRRRIEDAIQQQISADPARAEYLLCLSSVARHFERLANMATHIAEEVIHIIDGRIVRHGTPVEESSSAP